MRDLNYDEWDAEVRRIAREELQANFNTLSEHIDRLGVTVRTLELNLDVLEKMLSNSTPSA